jgi:hypothetical protein
MSYNLYAEGDVDFEALAQRARRCDRIELFPIRDDGEPDAIGIALPSSRIDDAAWQELEELLGMLVASSLAVWDLMTGERLETADDFDALRARLYGPN